MFVKSKKYIIGTDQLLTYPASDGSGKGYFC